MANSQEVAQLDAIEKAFNKVNTSIQKTNDSYLTIVGNIESGNQKIKNTTISYDNLAKAQKETSDIQENLTKSNTKLTEAEREIQKIEKERLASIKALDKQRQRGLAQLAKQEAKERELRDAIEKEVKSVNDAKAQNKALRLERDKLNATTEEGIKKTEDYNKVINENSAFLEENADAATQAKINVGRYREDIDAALESSGKFSGGTSSVVNNFIEISQQEGGIKSFFSTLTSGIGSATKAALKFILTPIGAVIAAVVAGIALFSAAISRNEGLADSFGEIWGGVSSIIDELIGRLFKFVGALIKITTGNFKGGFNDLKESVTGFSEAMSNAFEEGKRLKQLQIELAEANIAATTSQEILNQKIQELAVISGDATKSFKEREKAAEDTREAEVKFAETAISLAKDELELITLQVRQAQRQGTVTRTLRQAQADAIRAVIQAEGELTVAIADNDKERSELKQDRLEKDLDILIDGLDNVKTINERIIADERRTFAERQSVLDETTDLAAASFNRQIETIRQFTSAQFDENELLAEQDSIILNEKIRSLGLSEIIEGRLLEIIRERRIANQDLLEAQVELESAAATMLITSLEAQEAAIEESINTRKDILAEAFEENIEAFELEQDAEVQATLAAEEEKTRITEEQEELRRSAKFRTLEAIKQIFGAESKIGKAATAAQAFEAARQNLISLGVITAKNAEGQAKSAAALPFPFNIPLILGTIAQFAGIIGLFKKSKTPRFHTGKKGTPGDGFIAGDSPSGGALSELMTLKTGESMMVDTPTYFSGNKFKGATIHNNKETEAIIRRGEAVNIINFDTISLQKSNAKGLRRIERAINRNKKQSPSLISRDSNYSQQYANRLQ